MSIQFLERLANSDFLKRRTPLIQGFFENITPYLLLMPAMLILVSLIIYPLIFSLGKSLTDFNLGIPGEQFVGLKNFIDSFKDPNFQNSVKVSTIYSISAVTLELVLGFTTAHFLRRRVVASGLLTVLLILPMMVPPVVVGIIWLLMFQPDFSVVNGLLLYLGIKGPIWLQHPITALIAVVVADVWQWTPFFTMVLLAGLLSLPEEILEAAKVDGASGWRLFWSITVPLMRPLILVLLLIRLIDSLKIFDPIFVMTNGGPGQATQVLSLLIYRTGLPFMNISYASAMSYIFLIVMSVVTTLLINQLRKTR